MTRPKSRCVAPAPQVAKTAPGGERSEYGATQAFVCPQDPARMSPEERRAELGSMLAEGFRRQLENRSNCLATGDQPERACEGEAFDSLENRSKP